MTRRVLKFGGTSVGDLDRIAHVAGLVEADAAEGGGRAVVVSAMAGETDRLIGLTRAIAADSRVDVADEYDAVVAVGEQVAAGLLAMALRARGLRARSWTGAQAGLITDGPHAAARIAAWDAGAVGAAVDGGEIAVVAGFQGATRDGRISTLGRGGSDVTAVALAAALGAERCDVYTDVDGVYTTDPRIEARARRLDRISYEEMLEMASLGAKVMQTRSIELAMAHKVPVRVLSSLAGPGDDNPGTLICEEDAIMEKRIVSGVAYARDEALVSVLGLPNDPDRLAGVFARLGDAGINIDMIVHGRARTPHAVNVAFSVGRADLDRALALIDGAKAELGFELTETRTDLSKVSVVGVGMRSHASVAKVMFGALAEKGVGVDAVTTSEIKISALIPDDHTELAVRALHAAYGLDAA